MNNIILEKAIRSEAIKGNIQTIALALWNNTTEEQRKEIQENIDKIKANQQNLFNT